VILGRSAEELAALVAALGEPAYRARQLRDGVLHGARSVADITTLSKELRARMAQHVGPPPPLPIAAARRAVARRARCAVPLAPRYF
jgi:adenine C2-methylase RlmN of 23S rRNA A2503 and tRNA A37